MLLIDFFDNDFNVCLSRQMESFFFVWSHEAESCNSAVNINEQKQCAVEGLCKFEGNENRSKLSLERFYWAKPHPAMFPQY